MSLIISHIRITLFSFYMNSANDSNKNVSFVEYFIYFQVPVIVEFATLCLLTQFYSKVRLSNISKLSLSIQNNNTIYF